MSEYFHIRTIHSTIVVQSDNGQLYHVTADRLPNSKPLVVWRPASSEQAAVLIAENPGLAMHSLTGLSAHQRLTGVKLLALDGEGVAISMTPGRFFSAVEGQTETREAGIEFGRTDINSWEKFQLTECRNYEPPDELKDVLGSIWLFLSGSLIAARIPLPDIPAGNSVSKAKDSRGGLRVLLRMFRKVAAADEPRLSPMSAEMRQNWKLLHQTLYSLLPETQWTEIGLRLLAMHQLDGHRIRFEYDPWLEFALPQLTDWLSEHQDGAKQREVPRKLDIIAKSGLGGVPASLGHIATIALRSVVSPRKRICVLGTARNEGLYFLEWIAHHKNLGVEHLYIYSNDNDDGSDHLLQALAAAGEITWLKNELADGISAQDKAYCHALSMLPDILDYEWTAILDVDEFINLNTKRFDTLSEFLDWQSRHPTHAIGLNWLVFGSNGQSAWNPEPVSRRFPMPFGDVSPTIKTLCRTNLFFHSQPHFPVTNISTPVYFRDSEGSPVTYNPNSISTASIPPRGKPSAWVAHYISKSVDEFLWKCSRNQGNYPKTQGRKSLTISPEMAKGFLDGHTVPSSKTEARSFTQLVTEISRLRQLPGVDAAMNGIVANYRAKIPVIRDTFRDVMQPNTDECIQEFLAVIPLN